jgi:Ca-activated chloride channel family protein
VSFLWPVMLWSLVAIPLLAYGYVRLVRARDVQRAALGGLGGPVASGHLGRRRHVPVALFLLALTILCVALARPVATIDLPRREGTVILAFDVSASMRADDLAPDRLRAAKRAARIFVADQPESIDIGVVAFSTAAFEVVPPTEERSEVRAAIRRLAPSGATALGEGIVASINAIAGEPVVSAVVEGPAGEPTPDGAADEAPPAVVTDVPFLGSAAIVLLTDGEDTTPVDPLASADLASRAGVRIFPVGIGSPEGAVVEVDGYQVATRLDEARLRAIAASANGEYYRAEDSRSLRAVYDSIDMRFTVDGEETEITALLAAAAIVVLLLGAALSARWLGRVP